MNEQSRREQAHKARFAVGLHRLSQVFVCWWIPALVVRNCWLERGPPLLYIGNLSVLWIDGVFSTIKEKHSGVALELRNVGILVLNRAVLFVGKYALFWGLSIRE